jgi:DNA-binding transcriptional LysR family regulator
LKFRDTDSRTGVHDYYGFGLGANLNRYLGFELSGDHFEIFPRVRGLGTVGEYGAFALMPQVRARYPGIQLSLQIANSAVIEQRVRTNEVDLAVVGGHALRQGEVCVAAGLLDELVLIVPPAHRWARRREVWPSPPVLERLLIREEGSATRALTAASSPFRSSTSIVSFTV